MYKILYVTTGNEKEAKNIAETVVKEKLAACANIFPIQSVYSWKGNIEKDNEFAMYIKTKQTTVEKLINKIKSIHSYEVPCIVVIPIENGHQPFLNWIEKEVI